jgi:hypothetical protein
MFMGPLESTKPWSMLGVEGISLPQPGWRMIVERRRYLRLSSSIRRQSRQAKSSCGVQDHRSVPRTWRAGFSWRQPPDELSIVHGQESVPRLHGSCPAVADGAAYLRGAGRLSAIRSLAYASWPYSMPVYAKRTIVPVRSAARSGPAPNLHKRNGQRARAGRLEEDPRIQKYWKAPPSEK